MEYSAKIFNLSYEPFLTRDIHEWNDLKAIAQKMKPRDALSLDFFSTMQKSIFKRIQSPFLRQIFLRFGTYSGSDPWLAPATLNNIAHVELGLGVFAARGGMHALTSAYQKLAIDLGVDIRLQNGVRSILCTDGKAEDYRAELPQNLQGATMIQAKHNRYIRSFFNWYLDGLLRKDFSSFYAVGEMPAIPDTPLIVLPNHISWHDGFLIDFINRTKWNRTLYLMMLEKELNKYRFFSVLGAFSISYRSPQTIAESLAYSAAVLREPGSLLVLYPEGRLYLQEQPGRWQTGALEYLAS